MLSGSKSAFAEHVREAGMRIHAIGFKPLWEPDG